MPHAEKLKRKRAAPRSDADLSAAERAFAEGDLDTCERICSTLLRINPKHVEALHFMGLVRHRRGDLTGAVDFLRRAVSVPGVPPRILSNFSEIARQAGLLGEGERAARMAVAIDPRLLSAWNNLGIILQESGKLAEALNCLGRVVRAQPDRPDGHNNLANTAKRAGLVTLARQHWTEALRLRPDYPEALSNYSILLNEEGEYAAARTAATRALQLRPDLIDAHVNLALAEVAGFRYPEALRALDNILARAPRNLAAMCLRASVLVKLEEVDNAVAQARRAVGFHPNAPEAHHALGAAFHALGDVEAALGEYQLASALPGNVAERSLLDIALIYAERGRREEAIAAYNNVLERAPGSPAALFGLGDLVPYEPGDARLSKLEKDLGSPYHQSRSDRTLLHFALGKAYLDLKDPVRAFIHLDEGNRLRRGAIDFDIRATQAWMRSIPQHYNRKLFERFGAAGFKSPSPIFIVGMPRSGTTLLEQMLGRHPDIQAVGELRYVQWETDRLGDFPTAAVALSGGKLEKTGRAYADRVKRLANGKSHTVDKMPANFIRAGLIHLMLPNARIVHIRRDPVDTCLSCYSKLFAADQPFTYDQRELGLFYVEYARLMGHWKSVLPVDRFIEVEYEALVADAEVELRRLLDFVGLPWSDDCLTFYEAGSVVKTASTNQVRRPIYKTSMGRWRPYKQQLQLLLEALGVNGVEEGKDNGV